MADAQLINNHVGRSDETANIEELELSHLREDEDRRAEVGIALDKERLEHRDVAGRDGAHGSEIKDL